MTKLNQERHYFIEHLHEAFFIRKGYGAFAYLSIVDVMELFDKYLDSNESANLFIDRYVKSV